MVARFDGRNLRAERYLRSQAADLVTEIIQDQRDGLRGHIVRQMEAGSNPRRVALDLVGRVNSKTGRREGGIIGLHSQQIDWVESAQAELLSGDPDLLRNYLKRKARDKRFDPIVRRAIREGKAVSVEKARGMVQKYSAKLLKIRGESIARTETLASLHAAQDEGLQQLVDAGKLLPGQITRKWDSAEDSATRKSHRAMDDQERGLGESFVSPVTNARLMYPGDRTQGAPASETIQCRCRVVVDIDYTARLSRGD